MPANVPSDSTPKMKIPSLLLLVEDELPMTVADAAALWRSMVSVEVAVMYAEGEAIVGDAAGGTVRVERWRTLPCCKEAISRSLSNVHKEILAWGCLCASDQTSVRGHSLLYMLQQGT